MYKKKIFVVSMLFVLIAVSAHFSSQQSRNSDSVKPVQSSQIIGNEEDSFILSPTGEISEADVSVIKEKTAIDPNYDFSDSEFTLYAVKSTKLKDKPFTYSKSVKNIETGEKLIASGFNSYNNFYKIKNNGKIYYISSEYVTQNEQEVFYDIDLTKYAIENAKLYKDLNETLYSELELNSEIKVIAQNSDYFKVSAPEEGYVLKSEVTDDPTIIPEYLSTDFIKYNLTDEEYLQLARVCYREQGSVRGAAAEASLMCNLYELNSSNYSSLISYVKNSGWFGHPESCMNSGSCPSDVLKIVTAVLRDGKRTMPKYINEHDCFSDIISASNNGSGISASDRGSYIPHVTHVRNRYSSSYTFYCFPEYNSDPFGYTSSSLREKYGDKHYDVDILIEELGI